MAFEFALLVPIILVFLFGSLQYGTMLYTYNLMLNSARSSARGLAIGTLTADEAQTRIADTMPPWVKADKVQAVATDVGANSVQLVVTVPSSAASVVSFAPAPANISARVVMLKEG